MRKVRRIRRTGQGTAVVAAELDALPVDAATIDTKIALIQALIPVGLLHVAESVQQELEALTGPRRGDTGVLRRLLAGLSCWDYAQCAEAVPEAFGLSTSTLSRRYIKASTATLPQFSERALEGHDLVVLFLDGKTFAADTDEGRTKGGVTDNARASPNFNYERH